MSFERGLLSKAATLAASVTTADCYTVYGRVLAGHPLLKTYEHTLTRLQLPLPILIKALSGLPLKPLFDP